MLDLAVTACTGTGQAGTVFPHVLDPAVTAFTRTDQATTVNPQVLDPEKWRGLERSGEMGGMQISGEEQTGMAKRLRDLTPNKTETRKAESS